jgi:arylsulfatase A-like enzyme
VPLRILCANLVVASLVFAFDSTAARAADDAADAPPNFIIILTDDQRWDALGCMGNPVLRTPHIDRLAADGALFTNAFCTTSICAVSRATFLTGQFERRHKVGDFRTPLTKEQFAQTFPGLLRRHGYRTGLVGKWGLGGPLPKDEYDYFTGYAGQGRYFPPGKKGEPGEHLTHKLGAEALEFLDGSSPDRPFLLQLYTKAPHCQDGDEWQFQPDPRYGDLFADATVPAPRTATEEHFERLPPFLQSSEARVRWGLRFADPEMYQKTVKDYYRLIVGIDDVVGNLVARLREKGLDGNTVIVFTSDNGFYLGEHGLAGKWFMHEESIRLPLVIHDPRLPESRRGTTIPEIALSTDIAPTILDLAGIEIPEAMQGRSLVPLLKGEPVEWRDEFFYEHRFGHQRIPQTEGVRTTRWKYTRYISVDPVYEELFDLENDPHEERNLAGDPDYAETLAEMRERWKVLAREAE